MRCTSRLGAVERGVGKERIMNTLRAVQRLEGYSIALIALMFPALTLAVLL